MRDKRDREVTLPTVSADVLFVSHVKEQLRRAHLDAKGVDIITERGCALFDIHVYGG